jgi:hypothetical protein
MSLQQYHEALAWLAIGRVKQSGVVASNMGDIADDKKTSQADYLKVTYRIGHFQKERNTPEMANSVRQRWLDYCKSDFNKTKQAVNQTDRQFQRRATEQCMISGGMQRLQQLAEEMKAGNCTEKCAIAIMRLAEIDVRKVDFMELNTYSHEQLDHTFLVIGRE